LGRDGLSTGPGVSLYILYPPDQDGLIQMENEVSHVKSTELWRVIHNTTPKGNVWATIPVFKIRKPKTGRGLRRLLGGSFLFSFLDFLILETK